MTYAEGNSPKLLVPRVGGEGPQIWTYYDGDDDATVNGTDYFTNGTELGMTLGDFVLMYDTSNNVGSVLYVSAVDSDGNATTSFAAVS